jgi:hypothetical protein
LLLIAAGIAQAQVAPKAVITGPKEARCGSLVVLDATESTGTGRLWLLAVSPEETSFLPVEAGRQCIFASPVAGAYRFVLVVCGTNTNGGPAADMATHTVVLRSPDVPPVPSPVPPSPPTTNPYQSPSAEIRETLGAVLAVKLNRADATNLASLYDQARRLVESAPAARAAGTKPEIGTTSELRAWLVEHGRELGLAGKYAGLADAVDAYLAGQLGTRLRDVQATDATVLGGLAWAIWEGGR